MTTDFITIESHYGVPNKQIRAFTRNKCSSDLTEIIKLIASHLYPDEEFEILLLPAEPGSYKDVLKIIKKKPLETATTVFALGALVVGVLTYSDTHAEHVHYEKIQVVDDIQKCLALKEQIENLKENYEVNNIPEEKIKEVCGDLTIKKLKNDRYRILQDDDWIAYEETVLKDSSNNEVSKKYIARADFHKYIEALPENEEYSHENIEGVIELVSLVVKQKKEGKGIAWIGIYHGDSIITRGITILEKGEQINFFMQDTEFKKKIDTHEITFSSGDNMRIIFNIKGAIHGDQFQHRAIYVHTVSKFNEDIIEHKEKPSNDKFTIPPDQLELLSYSNL